MAHAWWSLKVKLTNQLKTMEFLRYLSLQSNDQLKSVGPSEEAFLNGHRRGEDGSSARGSTAPPASALPGATIAASSFFMRVAP